MRPRNPAYVTFPDLFHLCRWEAGSRKAHELCPMRAQMGVRLELARATGTAASRILCLCTTHYNTMQRRWQREDLDGEIWDTWKLEYVKAPSYMHRTAGWLPVDYFTNNVDNHGENK